MPNQDPRQSGFEQEPVISSCALVILGLSESERRVEQEVFWISFQPNTGP